MNLIQILPDLHGQEVEQHLRFIANVMRNREEYIDGYDIGLFVLVVTTGWLLIFHSGIFGR